MSRILIVGAGLSGLTAGICLARDGYEVETGQFSPIEVYKSEKYTIFNLSWSADGRLVIVDAPIEGSFAETVIYDPQRKQIAQSLPGMITESNWNSQRTAFYVINYFGDYGPICATTISGYNFIHDVRFPNLEFSSEDWNFYRTIDDPTWTLDGFQLLTTVKLDKGDLLNYDVSYGPASILALDITESITRQIVLYSDPTLDYFLTLLPDGNYKVSALPYAPVDCFELEGWPPP